MSSHVIVENFMIKCLAISFNEPTDRALQNAMPYDISL
ncbi:hypothetical protein AI2617V1_5061 (plasmid) [Serratia marcescens]|nr:hypothetical protein AI2617V1_5061 [Serratia marcescens]CAH4025030.1 hypothetical protein AI2617V1_5061 [Serratia marcescens]